MVMVAHGSFRWSIAYGPCNLAYSLQFCQLYPLPTLLMPPTHPTNPENTDPLPPPPTPQIHKGWATLSILILLGIYTLAWIGRPLVNFFTANGLMPFLTIMAAVAGLVAFLFVASRAERIETKKLVHVGAIFTFSQCLAFAVTRTLAEAIHVVEYESLAFCIYSALSPLMARRNLASTSILLVLIAGWSDEAMQYFAPDRYYDLLDVLLNTASGVFGVWMASIIHAAKETDR